MTEQPPAGRGPAGADLPDGATETAVVVPVPSAEPLVARHRARLDAAAAKGVPAHVTVLYPFVAPAGLTARCMERLASAVASVPSFDGVLEAPAWFGDEVAWLRPDPSAHRSFVALTRAVWRAFPGCPPYGGAFGDEVTPHLTVGESRIGGVDAVRAAVADMERHLPVRFSARSAVLLAGRDAPDSWRVVRRLPLG